MRHPARKVSLAAALILILLAISVWSLNDKEPIHILGESPTPVPPSREVTPLRKAAARPWVANGIGTGATGASMGDTRSKVPELIEESESESNSKTEADPGCDIEANILLDGEAAATVAVTLIAHPLRELGWRMVRTASVTSREGVRFARVDPGTYRLLATSRGYAMAPIGPFSCSDGLDVRLSLVLRRAAGCVRGRVVDDSDQPVAASWVEARKEVGPVTMKDLRETTPTEVLSGGSFVLCLPNEPENYGVVAGAWGYQPTFKRVPKDWATAEMILGLSPQTSVSGVLVGPDGPAADATVALATSRDSTTVTWDVQTDTHGHFSVPATQGPAQLGSWHSGMWAYLEIPPRRESEDLDGVVLNLKHGRTLTGNVHLSNGDAVLMPFLLFAVADMPIGGSVQGGADGSFEIPGLPPGRQIVVYPANDRRPMSESAVDVGPDQTDVDVLLVPEDS